MQKTAFILDFKNEYTTSKNTAVEAAQQAMKQIKEKHYVQGVKKTGIKEVVKIGLGFKGKEVAIEWE